MNFLSFQIHKVCNKSLIIGGIQLLSLREERNDFKVDIEIWKTFFFWKKNFYNILNGFIGLTVLYESGFKNMKIYEFCAAKHLQK